MQTENKRNPNEKEETLEHSMITKRNKEIRNQANDE